MKTAEKIGLLVLVALLFLLPWWINDKSKQYYYEPEKQRQKMLQLKADSLEQALLLLQQRNDSIHQTNQKLLREVENFYQQYESISKHHRLPTLEQLRASSKNGD